MKKKVEKVLIKIALKIAKQGKGCLFVIEKNKVDYDLMIPNDIKPFDIFTNERRLETLGLIDGALIISPRGKLLAYSARIKTRKTFPNYGTRHSAGYSASLNNNISIVASEEDKKVRIFKNGSLVMQLDSLEKNLEKKTSEMIGILESVGAGTIGTIGTTILVPTVGIALFSGIVVFGSSYYLGKLLIQKLSK